MSLQRVPAALAHAPSPGLLPALALALGLLLAGAAQAQDTGGTEPRAAREPAGAEPGLPLWEAGLGVGAVTLPDYPGADQTDNYVSPVPYFIYRGEIFKSDRDGMRAQFLQGERYEFDVSLGATPPVFSQDSDTRQGMPDLAAALEIGPELRIHLDRDSEDAATRRYELNLHIPVRHSMTHTQGHFTTVGNVTYPHLNWKQRYDWLGHEWELDADAGAYFNDRSYHQYFYEVLPQYATPTRRAYEAHGGYGGWEASIYTSQKLGRYRVGGYLQGGGIGGAAFADSPLVRRNFFFSAGFVVTYVFWVSDRRTGSGSGALFN